LKELILLKVYYLTYLNKGRVITNLEIFKNKQLINVHKMISNA
jgi:hypothetical protein